MSASRGRKCAEEAQFSLKVSTGVAIACIKSKTISQTTYTQLTNSTSIFSQTLLATQTQIEDQEKLNHHALAVVNPPTLEISQCSDDGSCEILDNAEAVNENMIIKLDLPRDETKKVIVIGRNNLDAHDSFEEDLLDVTMTSDKSADSQVEWYANKQQMSKLRPINATIERIALVEPLKPPRDAAVSISQSGPPSRASGRPRPIPVIRNAHPQQKIVRPVRQVKATVPPHCVRGRPRLTPKAPATAVDWRRMNKLETIGRTVQARKIRSHWSELIELQADWIRLVAVKSNINVSEIGFALNCWKIVTRNFTYAKNSFSVEIQKLTLMFLSNSIKILEITITKGHGEVQEQAINFLQIVLKKYIKNPLIMNDYNVSPIFPALQLIVNHTTSLKNLLVVYSSLIDIQSKYMTSWQKFNRTQAVTDQDINFFVYVLNEIDSLCKAANLRIQQQRRATMFHLSF